MKTEITVKAKRGRGYRILYGISFLLLSLFASNALRAQSACVKTQTFSAPITTGSAAPNWYPDRYAPSGFSVSTASDPQGAGRLKQSIDAATGSLDNRPSSFQTNFYNTQGRKFDLAASANTVQVDLFIDPTWSAAPAKRWAGFWATAFNASNTVSAYPIVEYTTDGGARFRCYDNGSWIDMNSSVATATGWVTMRIKLMPTGQFAYHIQAGANTAYYLTTGYGTSGSTAIGNIILQGHNETSAATNAGYTYDIYWDNFRTEFPGATATVTNNGPVCTGADVTFNITGTPNATVTYNLNGGTSATTTLSAAGASSVVVTAPVADQTLNLLSILNPVTDCSQALSGSSIADVGLGPVTNTTSSNQYCTIQAAIAAASTNDVIQISAGTYNERLVIDKKITLQGDPAQARANIILDGTGLSGTGSGIFINSGIEGVVIQNLTIRNYTGANGNSNAGIYATAGNNGLEVQNVSVTNNPNASGFYANGPVDGITINGSEFSNNGGSARGIVIWNGLKTNITITNNTVNNNNCCGIEMQDGTASGVWIKGNNILANDNAIGLVGATAAPGVTRANVIENNTITVNGRFGIEIKNPDGTGLDTETNGAIIVKGNTVSLTSSPVDARDRAGISVYRRGVLAGNVDVPTGVVVKDNTVSGFRQTTNSTGFGIVIEGTNHTVTGNILNNNDVALQQQAGHSPYPADGNQDNTVTEDDYFGRGNSPVVCGNTIASNIFGTVGGANTMESRIVGLAAGGGIVTNTITNKTFCSIQAAINDATTINGHVIELGVGIYNEQVLVNKSITIKNKTGEIAQVDFTGTVTNKPTIFDVSVNDVTIDGLLFNVDLAKLKSAIISSGASVNKITIKNNTINPYGVPMTGNYGDRNAISINYSGNTNYRTGDGVEEIVMDNNTITSAGTSIFRSGLSADASVGTFTNNDIQSLNQDLLLRFGNVGNVMITGNEFKGGGVEIGESNGTAGTYTIANNTFNGTAGSTYTSSLRLRDNLLGKQTNVTNNIFTGHTWGISLENFKAVTISGNTFTPSTVATAFRHITVNTKLIASTALASLSRVIIDANISGNIFNGSTTATNGKGIAFYNHWKAATAGSEYGDFVIGTPTEMNTFHDGMTNYIFIDSINNVSSNAASVAANYPEYAGASAAVTPIGYWTKNIVGTNNVYAGSIGGTPETFAAMDFNERYNYLYGHIFDKVDNVNIGRVVFETPVHNITHPSDYASIQEAIDAAVTVDGDVIVADAGIYREHLIVNKSVTIRGANTGVSGNSATRVAETVLAAMPTSLTQSLINLYPAKELTIDGFTIADAEQIMSNSNTDNRMVLKNTIVRDITSAQNTSGHNLYWTGDSLTLENNKVTFSGLNTNNNGGKSHFFIAAGKLKVTGNNFSSSALSNPASGTTARPVMFNLTSTLSQAKIHDNVFDDFGLGMLLAANASNLDIYHNDFRNAVEPASSTYGAAIAFYEGFNPSGLVNIHNNNFENSTNGIRTSGSGTSALPAANLLRIRHNKFSGMTNAAIRLGTSFTGTLDALCNSFGTAAPFAPELGTTGNVISVLGTATINHRNWLVYGDDAAALGFQTKTQYTVASTGNIDSNNNDYRLLSNAIGCAVKGDEVTLDGSFDWNNPIAIQEWEKGNDGKIATTADNWSIVMPLNVDSVTLTGTNTATVNGPGDLPQANLEAFIASNTGHNTKWNINNLTIKDFDLAISFSNTTSGAADSLQLHHNTIYIPKDLNANVAATDASQNIGVILSNGKGQQIHHNTFFVDGTGESFSFAQKSTSVVLQTTTTGGTMYDGLRINDNTITVTGMPNADTAKAAYIIGLWENGHNKNADIQLFNNKFLNDNAGNLAANNKQMAFRVTSRSGASKTVTYNHNEIDGFNRGIEWIGDPYSTFAPYAYDADAMPVAVVNNKMNNVHYGVSVRKDNASANANAPAFVNENSFTGIGAKAVTYTAITGTLDANCNYYDATDLAQVIEGNVNFGMFLNSGANIATIGFEPATTTLCIGRVHNITQNTWYPTIQSAIDHSSTITGDIIEASAGTYKENVLVNKSVTVQGVGNTTKVVSVTPNGNTMTVAANAVTIKDMQVQGLPDALGNSATRGIYFNTPVSNTSVENVLVTQHQYAIHADNVAVVNGLRIVNPELSHSGNGLQVDASAKVAKLYINGGTIHDNQYGLSSTATLGVSNKDGLQNVSITGVTFSNNFVKGMYFEKLDSAKITANTFSNNGTSTASPSALDINLKSGSYTNIVVLDNILNSNSSGSATGTGIAVKARNDNSYAGANAASLSSVFVNSNEITGTPIGLSIGYDVTASSIAHNLITGATKGVVVYGMPANYTTTLLNNSIMATTATIENANVATSPVVATCNWLGNTTDATIAASIIGNVSYNPWLISGTDAATTTIGFQPSVPCASRPTAVITPNTTTICAGSPATLSVALTGLAPWTVTYSDGTTPVTITGVTTSPLEVNVTPTVNTNYTVTALSDANYPALAEDMTGIANVIVTPTPTAAIAYSSSPFCKTSTAELVTLTGTNAYTGGAFTSTAGLTIDGVTGQINPSVSTAGAYTVTYTTLASGGCAAVNATASVIVKELVTATVSAPSAPIILNSSTTSTVTFTGNGGEAPYTFRYKINGVLQPAISSSSTSNVVTVAHPNNTVGTFNYTLDSVRDASGCYGEVSTATAVVSVVQPDNSVDLRAYNVMNDNSFALPGELSNPATINLYNMGAAGSVTSGLITLYVYVSNGVSLSLPSGSQWILTPHTGYYEISSSTIQINQGTSAFVSIDLQVEVQASMSKGNYLLPIEIAEGAGSEGLGNSGNNFSSLLINVTQ